ncbi:nuclear transport factor 2 family protein [Mycobacterium sp. 852014-52144_SCH5372336]|uniref:nuclear transport factor 2 family protein n=1 Tax=Mycobacterium sp. 852014-52144_SCH5372336 TaxID=1834115 RepID=UPI0007FE83CC|nr:nuclear transport factor 2 family protein [Mycobacterium sp. 852014-52144_SCH5372336]OBB76847.1 Ring hydroxylating enzyme beta subunit [Mycobacterium sp. 852014-52144_SCH5372336]
MSDSAREIENLVYAYAERIDAGDLEGVGALFAHGRINAVENGPPDTVFEGANRAREMFAMAVRLYDDGTPRTKHLTTNVTVLVDDEAGTARGSAYYCVTQATPDLPLQVIVTGRYRDTFHRVDGAWWFDTRTIFIDQVGDTSHHLKF